MWRPASRVLLYGARSQVGARLPGCAARVTASAGQDSGVTGGSFLPAAVWLPTHGRLTTTTTTTAAPHRLLHTTAAPHRLLHTTAAPHSNSTALVEAELDRLYSSVEVECRGHEPAVLRSYQKFVSTTAAHLDVPLEEIEWPRRHYKRWTLLKSVHIHKKHRVQYEARTYFLIMRFARLTGSTADTFLEYIQRNLPEGMAMKVTMHELQKLPPHVTPSSEVMA